MHKKKLYDSKYDCIFAQNKIYDTDYQNTYIGR